MNARFDRRSLMRGALGGAAVVMGIPALDMFLDGNGFAYADGRKLPVRFGTYFWGLGLTDTPTVSRWVPKTTGRDWAITPELQTLASVKNKVSVFSGFRAIGDGRPNLVHWSGSASIMTGMAPAVSGVFEAPSFDTTVADSIGGASRFKALDLTPTGKPISYSTRTGRAFATPEVSPLGLYTRLFGEGFQDPNDPNWKPDPSVMVRQSILSAVTDQRQALLADAGKADRVKLDQYFTSVRDMENQLALQLERPEKCEACVVPPRPAEGRRGQAIDAVNENSKAMAKLLAMGLACNQTKVFNFLHTAGSSETYFAGDSKIYHQYTHDEANDSQLGYQPTTSKLAMEVMKGLGDFLQEMDAVKEGDGTLLDHMLVMAYSDTGYAKIHSLENIPVILAGAAGGRHKTGAHVQAKGEPVTRIALTAQQLVGVPTGEFGGGSMKTARPVTEVMA